MIVQHIAQQNGNNITLVEVSEDTDSPDGVTKVSSSKITSKENENIQQ